MDPRQTRSSARNPRLLTAGAAGLLLLAITALAALALGNPRLPGAPRPGASPSPSASPSLPLPSVGALRRAAGLTGPRGSVVTGVATDGTRLVAVGFDGTNGALIWTSTDGDAWSPATGEGFARVSIASVAYGDGRWVAVGRDLTDIEQDLGAAWLSTDGSTWRRITSPAFDGAQLVSITAAGTGFVAVGTLLEGVDAAAAWTTADGETWTLAPVTRDLEHSFMWSVTTGGPGLVATGWTRDPEPTAAFWTSRDGLAWARAPLPMGGTGLQGRAVLDLGGSLVAVGDRVEGGAAALWISTDARSWTPLDPAPGGSGAFLTALARVPGGVVAAGGQGIDAAAWTSPDGTTWSSLPTSDAMRGAYVTSAVALSDRLVVAGASQRQIPDTNSFEQTAAIWVASLE